VQAVPSPGSPDRGGHAGRFADPVPLGGGHQHRAQAGTELDVHLGHRTHRGEAVADGHQLGELAVGLLPRVAPETAVGLVEKLREALGAPAVENVEIHRGHLPSLDTVPTASLPTGATEPADFRSTTGRTRTNG
jgi:hypothetical protein